MIPLRAARSRYVAAAALVLLAGSLHAAETRKAPPRPVDNRVHIVERGDTLSGLALRYGVTVPALVTANRLPSQGARLKIGQRLTIPDATATPSTRRPPKSLAAAPAHSVRDQPAMRWNRPCCGPRGLKLGVPEWAEVAPLFTWPVEGPVTSTFGRRRSGWHRGIDIKAERGAAIFAAAPGFVVASEIQPRYGRVIKIEHDGGFLTVYAHNEENLVERGIRVAAGDPIGTIGRTGRATAHHLHFEIRHDGSVYNPLYLLPLPPRVGQVEEGEETEEEHD